MPNHLRQPSGPGWALVGDAGYHRDAITGYGISDAFRDAELLATALDAALRDPRDEAAALSDVRPRARPDGRGPSSTSPASSAPSRRPSASSSCSGSSPTVIDEQAGELAARPSRVQAAVA